MSIEKPRMILVANVAKEHVLKFHVPTIKMLKEAGWCVDVACSGDEEVPYCDHQYHMSYKRNPFTPKTFKGIKELKEIINNGNYDVVYCHTPVGGMVGRLASIGARKRGTKVIYFAHGFHFYKGAPLINWLLYYPVEKILARFTDKVITINDEDTENARRLLKVNQVMQLPGMGIDLTAFYGTDVAHERKRIREELNIPENAWVMIYLAELIPNKNQKMLLDVLKKVCQVNNNTYLLLAGVDHYNGEIQKYASEIGVEKNYRYLGWRSDKEALYSAADVCTATSIREGFGLNLVEAMAIGLPIVATNNRGHKTIVVDGVNGYLVDINDSDKMAKRVVEIMTNNTLKTPTENELKQYDQNEIIKRIIGYVSK